MQDYGYHRPMQRKDSHEHQRGRQAGTNEPSYFKQTSKKTTLLVSAASEVFVGNDHVRYQSAVACQQVR